MNGRHPEPDRSVPSQTIYFRTGQQRVENRGNCSKNSNGPKMPAHKGHGDETQQGQEYNQRLFGNRCFRDVAAMAMGQGIGGVSHVTAESAAAMNNIPFIRKVSLVFTLLVAFSISYHSVKWWFKEPPEDFFTSAIASERNTTNLVKSDKLWNFVEDCY